MFRSRRPSPQVQRLAQFVVRCCWGDLSDGDRKQLRLRILDTVGCAIGALHAGPVTACRRVIDELGGGGGEHGPCTLMGGGRAAPHHAAFYNGALVRYLDFMDNFMAQGETCHPSDNFAGVLAACEYADRSGGDLMTALALAYQVQCRLTEEAPIMSSGFDHTTQHALSVAAGMSKGMGLSLEQTRNALAIAGSSGVALAVTRATPVSQWKGLASARTALDAAHSVFLARESVTGPVMFFEGPKGFEEAMGNRFVIDWDHERLDVVARTALKRFNAEVHTQSTLEALVDLRAEHHLTEQDITQISRVKIETFKTAFAIVGGGEFGRKNSNHTKEECDHSLPYLAAVALLAGDVQPEHFHPDWIERRDVQQLLGRVEVRAKRSYTRRYPAQMYTRVTVTLRDGSKLQKEKTDYLGFPSRPMDWAHVEAKFHRLASPFADADLRGQLVEAIRNLESMSTREFTALMARVGPQIVTRRPQPRPQPTAR